MPIPSRPFGLSFQPGAVSSQGERVETPPAPIQFLRLRLPETVGDRPLAARPLLAGSGTSGPLSIPAVIEALLRTPVQRPPVSAASAMPTAPMALLRTPVQRPPVSAASAMPTAPIPVLQMLLSQMLSGPLPGVATPRALGPSTISPTPRRPARMASPTPLSEPEALDQLIAQFQQPLRPPNIRFLGGQQGPVDLIRALNLIQTTPF